MPLPEKSSLRSGRGCFESEVYGGRSGRLSAPDNGRPSAADAYNGVVVRATAVVLLAGFTVAGCGTSKVNSFEPAPATGFVTGPHGRLRIDDGGPRGGRIPVLFVHGNGGNWTQWAGTLAHLRPSRRAVALDLSGFGESDWKPGEPITVEGYAEDVAAAADRAGLGRFVLVGHSYGGAVVAAYAGMHPDRLAGLVFADCAGDLHETPDAALEPLRRGLREHYEEVTAQWFEGILAGSKPETRQAVLASLRRTPPDVFRGATDALYRFRIDDSLARYPGPKLSIASYLFENPAAIHKKHPEIPVRRIENASYWLMLDQPEAFQGALDEFLASLTSPPK